MTATSPASAAPAPRKRHRWLRRALLVLLLAWAASAAYQAGKPLPEGLGAQYPVRATAEVALLADVTWTDSTGARRHQQQVFAEILRLVAGARRLLVVDMFLFNDFGAAAAPVVQPLSAVLTTALVERRREVPGLQVLLVTDPINTVYGGLAAPHLEALRAAGVQVVVTDLARLRAPNPAWTGAWQLCCAWLGNDPAGGWLPNPFGEGRVTLRSYLAVLNLRANHRKLVVADDGDDWVGLVASANPHDASSAHGNSALRFSGAAALDLLHSERAVVRMSGGRWPQRAPEPAPLPTAHDVPQTDAAGVQVLTEGAIRDALLASVRRAGSGDALDVAVFYFAHRELLAALLDAHRRGATVRVLLDPNRDAFGRIKNGIPNRQVALEMHAAGIPVRWCDTRGEQCHSKLLLHRHADGNAELIAGSANFTRRNLDDYNLETSVRVLARADSEVMRNATLLFTQAWENRDGRQLSLPYAAYADPSSLRYWRYRIAEATGLSSF